jgi:hypothetical protein
MPYDEYTVLDTIIMGNPRLYEITVQKEAPMPRRILQPRTGFSSPFLRVNLRSLTVGKLSPRLQDF